jgi:hypothetical protein
MTTNRPRISRDETQAEKKKTSPFCHAESESATLWVRHAAMTIPFERVRVAIPSLG